MDPISKALERARQEAPSVREWVQPAAGPGPEARLQAAQPRHAETVSLDPAHLRANRILCGTHEEDPIITDRYRLLRTRCQQMMRANGWRLIGVTSPGMKAGKTVTAINCAISVAREGTSDVILIDADIRKPSAAAYLGVDGTAGLPDYLAGHAALPELLVGAKELPTLSIITGNARRGDEPSPDILKSERLAELFQVLKATHPTAIVIVDLPPVLVGDDVIAVAAQLDALLIVVDETSTTIDDLKKTVDLLAGFNVLGTVLNKSEEKAEQFEGYYQPRGKSSVGEPAAG